MGRAIIAKNSLFGYYIGMKITICSDKKSWDSHLLGQKQAEFLQSWEWGEFQKKNGSNPIRMEIWDGEIFMGQVQGFETKIFPFIKFVYLPRITSKSDIFDYLKTRGYVFARVEPQTEIDYPKNFNIFSTTNRQPQNTFLLNLLPNEDELLNSMHAKTRYNIRLAEKKDVTIKQEKNIDAFWKLNEETFARDKFKSHDREYYKKMLDMENCFQLTAYLENEPIASNILIHFGDTMTYLHGASSDKSRNVMAPYLLQWYGFLLTKKLGAEFYDFGGVSPEKKEGEGNAITCYHNYCWEAAHKWTGITRFKVGFGGFGKKYPEASEIVFNIFLYNVFNFVKFVKNFL